MALLRWIYLRKLVPIEDLIAGLPSGGSSQAPKRPMAVAPAVPPPAAGSSRAAPARRVEVPIPPQPAPAMPQPGGVRTASDGGLKDAFLAEIRKSKSVFYNTVVAQAQKIDVTSERVSFVFSAGQRALRDVFEQHRTWLESIAQAAAGRRIAVTSVQIDPVPAAAEAAVPSAADRKAALKERALADAGVQALLEVFPAEIRDVEEM
jgi:hypothetical protein